jgi:hypothetical protein
MARLSFDQYFRLSPEEQLRQDDVYRRRLTDPQYLAFLGRLFRMTLLAMERSRRCEPSSITRARGGIATRHARKSSCCVRRIKG